MNQSELTKTQAVLWGIFVILVFLLLCSLIFALTWNLALVPLVATCGGTIGKISLLQGLGVFFILNLLHYDIHKAAPLRKKD